jgi:hypothetical protein
VENCNFLAKRFAKRELTNLDCCPKKLEIHWRFITAPPYHQTVGSRERERFIATRKRLKFIATVKRLLPIRIYKHFPDPLQHPLQPARQLPAVLYGCDWHDPELQLCGRRVHAPGQPGPENLHPARERILQRRLRLDSHHGRFRHQRHHGRHSSRGYDSFICL